MNKKVLYGVVIAMAMVIGGLGTWIVTDNLNDKETEKIENSKQQESLSVEEKMVNDIQDAFFSDSDAVVTYSEKDEDVSIIVTAKSSEMLSDLEDEAVWKKTYKPLMEKVSKYVTDDYGSKYKVKLSKPKSEGKEYLLILANGSIQEDLFPYTKKKEVVEEKSVESSFSVEEEMIADLQNEFFSDESALVSYEETSEGKIILITAKDADMIKGLGSQDTWETVYDPLMSDFTKYALQQYGASYKVKLIKDNGDLVYMSGGVDTTTEAESAIGDHIEVENLLVGKFGDTFEINEVANDKDAVTYYLFVKPNTELDQLFTSMYNLDYEAIGYYQDNFMYPVEKELKNISAQYPETHIIVGIISPTNLSDIVNQWDNGEMTDYMFASDGY